MYMFVLSNFQTHTIFQLSLNMWYTKLFILFLAICIQWSNVSAQVTIGSAYEPKSGAILDLKQENTNGSNSNKGLMLPRVSLKSLSKLYPMFESDKDYNNSSEEKELQDKLHRGLIVYNTNECFNINATGKGVYTWDGSKWVRIGEETNKPINSRVSVYQDQEGKDFLAAAFGVAGEWMLQNLSVSTYSDKTELGGPSVGSDNMKRWAYPNPNGNDPLNSSSFKAQPDKGYLYNWYAAMNTDQTAGKDEGYVNNPDDPNMLLVGDRGICPSGWHVPSDVEWSTLESFIITNPQDFSDLDPNMTTPIDLVYQGDRGTHSRAMRAICLPIEIAKKGDGLSFSPSEAGFASILAGEIINGQIQGFGEKTAFWTASSYDNTQVWKREFSLNKDAVGRLPAAATDMLSIRCKKTQEFKRCGDPLTDSEGNTYATASFGEAGCWMTQNLRSTKNSQTELTENLNSENGRKEVYAKPNGNELNPEYGYLYTWDAAIAGWDNSEEPLMSSAAAKRQSAMQGICPEGWVVPSDLDWNQLEQEISTNPSKYSSTLSEGSWNTTHASVINWRPNENSGWGESFKTTAYNGTSIPNKGMEVEMAGGLESGQGQQFGNYAYFWTSNDVFTSLGGDARARYRGFSKDAKGVYRDDASKSSMLSVRCKQYIAPTN